jgi:uncharacterized membrane protein
MLIRLFQSPSLPCTVRFAPKGLPGVCGSAARIAHLCAPSFSDFSRMTPTTRRVLQAVLYEVGAVAFVGPVLGFAFEKPASSTFLLAVVLSTIALCWNYVFNALFERWESRQVAKGRGFARRVAHGAGFEGGLTFILVPVMAWWLDTTFLAAFIANLGLLAFFFVYAIAYTWLFDRVFGLPQSAR